MRRPSCPADFKDPRSIGLSRSETDLVDGLNRKIQGQVLYAEELMWAQPVSQGQSFAEIGKLPVDAVIALSHKRQGPVGLSRNLPLVVAAPKVGFRAEKHARIAPRRIGARIYQRCLWHRLWFPQSAREVGSAVEKPVIEEEDRRHTIPLAGYGIESARCDLHDGGEIGELKHRLT